MHSHTHTYTHTCPPPPHTHTVGQQWGTTYFNNIQLGLMSQCYWPVYVASCCPGNNNIIRHSSIFLLVYTCRVRAYLCVIIIIRNEHLCSWLSERFYTHSVGISNHPQARTVKVFILIQSSEDAAAAVAAAAAAAAKYVGLFFLLGIVFPWRLPSPPPQLSIAI